MYWIAATNISQARRGAAVAAGSETAALDKARGMSSEVSGVSFGVFEVNPSEGACLVASFFNGERRFTVRTKG